METEMFYEIFQGIMGFLFGNPSLSLLSLSAGAFAPGFFMSGWGWKIVWGALSFLFLSISATSLAASLDIVDTGALSYGVCCLASVGLFMAGSTLSRRLYLSCGGH